MLKRTDSIRDRKFRRIRDPSNEYRNKVIHVVPISTGIYHGGRSFLESTIYGSRHDIRSSEASKFPSIADACGAVLEYSACTHRAMLRGRGA